MAADQCRRTDWPQGELPTPPCKSLLASLHNCIYGRLFALPERPLDPSVSISAPSLASRSSLVFAQASEDGRRKSLAPAVPSPLLPALGLLPDLANTRAMRLPDSDCSHALPCATASPLCHPPTVFGMSEPGLRGYRGRALRSPSSIMVGTAGQTPKVRDGAGEGGRMLRYRF
ncbi:hypothetical protein MPH_09367 [Macrophomina phaseolina MS6]|uniref:Uncharacterized protein n=1 Tax=Macrophomina phaseolina (strain MS6) TaxID=1126212 RepID=K2RTI7_MACPH|nr:hypothetical protein MPH_09367 [Macrophomina phaseolina MS6]